MPENNKNKGEIVMKTVKKVLAVTAAAAMVGAVCAGCSDTSGKKIEKTDDLEGARIGVQLGTTGAIYAKDVKNASVEEYNKGADAVMALNQGKVDCVIIDEQPAKVFVKQNSGLSILDEEFANEDYAAVIKKENTQLLDDVNKALAELKADGTLDKIISSYIPAEGEEAGSYHYTQTVTDGDKLVMATNAQFPPYEYYESNEIVGIDVEIGKAIADKLGKVLSIEDMEFDSIINSVSSGKADIGLAGFTVTEDRKKQINFSESYTNSKQVIIVKK